MPIFTDTYVNGGHVYKCTHPQVFIQGTGPLASQTGFCNSCGWLCISSHLAFFLRTTQTEVRRLRLEDLHWWLHLAWCLSDSPSVFSDNGLHAASIRSAASKLHSREGAFLHFSPNVSGCDHKSHCFVAQVKFYRRMFLWSLMALTTPTNSLHFNSVGHESSSAQSWATSPWPRSESASVWVYQVNVWFKWAAGLNPSSDEDPAKLCWIFKIQSVLNLENSVKRRSRKSPVCLHVLQIN